MGMRSLPGMGRPWASNFGGPGERRHVEDVGLRAVLGVERQRHLPLVDELVDLPRLVVEVAHEAQPPHALLRAGRREPLLHPREAEDALLRPEGPGVEVDLLVGAAGDAVAQPLAALLVHQHHAVLVALEDRAARAGRQAARVGAVVADAGQVEEPGCSGSRPPPASSSQFGPALRLADRADHLAERRLVEVEVPGRAVVGAARRDGALPQRAGRVEAAAHAPPSRGG